MKIFVGTHEISGIHQSYNQGRPGRLLALIGSGGYLEIACNLGRAVDLIGLKDDGNLKVEVLTN